MLACLAGAVATYAAFAFTHELIIYSLCVVFSLLFGIAHGSVLSGYGRPETKVEQARRAFASQHLQRVTWLDSTPRVPPIRVEAIQAQTITASAIRASAITAGPIGP
jgi:hypothetical protein